MKKVKKTRKALIETRINKGKRMASSPTMTVTLRIPKDLNEWLQRYVSLSYPEKISKGHIVTQALILAYLSRGEPKEEFLELK